MAREFDEINVEYRDANKRSIFYEAVLDAAIEMVGTRVHRQHPVVGRASSASPTATITFPLVVVVHAVHRAVLRAGEPARAALHGAPVGHERRRAHLRAARRDRRSRASIASGDRRAHGRHGADGRGASRSRTSPSRTSRASRSCARSPSTCRRASGSRWWARPARARRTVTSLLLRLYELRAGDRAGARQGRRAATTAASSATCSRSSRRTSSCSRAPSPRTSP